MTRPLIGLTSGRHLEPAERGRMQDVVAGCSIAYVREVERAGGTPLILPVTTDPATVERAIASLDGLLLTGGGDVDPVLLGEDPHPRVRLVDPERDATEVAAIRAAVREGAPILGICRGIQILNVALGGKLIQHIDEGRPGAVCHSQHSVVPGPSHPIDVVAGSLLAGLVGEGRHWVNSHHHQAVGELAPGLVATARASDGIVEAVESSEGKPILGVQFHPERTAEKDPESRAFFRWLVDRAAGRGKRR